MGEMRLFWMEVDAEARTTSLMEPEWKMLRQSRNSKDDVKALGKRLRLQHQRKGVQKQKQLHRDERNTSTASSRKRSSKHQGLIAEFKEGTRAADMIDLAAPVDLA